ncbi:hypothetical protein H9P43_001595 [Blastocladiella emersonii ATCC 22665]|nr:hypothetical protein H9P43_001595 [Blastocladiella emersonii ATCC 22665]
MFRSRMHLAARRMLSTATETATAAASESTFRATPLPPPKKPLGAVRGGLMGLLLGFVIAGGVSYYNLQGDYSVYSNALLTNVEQLGGSVEAIRASLAKADSLEAEVKAVKGSAIKRDDLEKARKDLYKAIDNLTVEHLELKTRVWALEQELKKRQ